MGLEATRPACWAGRQSIKLKKIDDPSSSMQRETMVIQFHCQPILVMLNHHNNK
jgi:hypothetical protein